MIKLDQFLKLIGIAASGGHAKQIIVNGEVKVNGEIEIRRGRKLVSEDIVTLSDQSFTVGNFID